MHVKELYSYSLKCVSVRSPRQRYKSITALFAWTLSLAICHAAELEPINFNRDIRPILADRCFACHGPDAENGETSLRLDDRDIAVDYGAIVPRKPEESELLNRVSSQDLDVRMPPSKAGNALSTEQIELLTKWISSGAEYSEHWAFVAPQKAEIPQFPDSTWPRNAIDNFVLAKMKRANLAPSPEADLYSLARRLYIDLTGLPPTPEEADDFVNDKRVDAYERLVNRLLASPKYGERWARPWLDLARYADTNGYEKDRAREIWPYRDWVVRALNADMPFDQFTVEQIAGDMLPNATLDQKVATGFHRNTMLNEEGGIDPLEYRYYAMVDRVATTGTTWLGLTLGCCQCHTHKYDPISHTEYFRFMALLNNTEEPEISVPNEELISRRNKVMHEIEEAESALPQQFPPLEGVGPEDDRRRQNFELEFTQWINQEKLKSSKWTTLLPTTAKSNLPNLEILEDGAIFASGDFTKRDVYIIKLDLSAISADDQSEALQNESLTAIRIDTLPDKMLPLGGPGIAYYEGPKGSFFLSEVKLRRGGEPVGIRQASYSHGASINKAHRADPATVLDGNGTTGWTTEDRPHESHHLILQFAKPLSREGELEIELLFERHYPAALGKFRISASTSSMTNGPSKLPFDLEEVLADLSSDQQPTGEAKDRLIRYYIANTSHLAEPRKKVDEIRKQIPKIPHTFVMRERRPGHTRLTHRHHRGEYLNSQEVVQPGIPSLFVSEAEQPTDRMGLARWLVCRENPLSARVVVNRAWRAFFGTGLVLSDDDFGTQCAPPFHPELLDWLAVDFMDGGWSMKRLHRMIVTSAVYRQDSRNRPEQQELDPENLLLARGPRHRVDAEIVRDLLLKSSGLLSEKMYGPSVYPPQPKSVTALAYGNFNWTPSEGEDRYRRSLYTFSKRTAPFAALSVFDAPSGEKCVARRDRSNTPLQALTLLNDAMFLEMSQHAAKEVLKEYHLTDESRITSLFRMFLTRPPQPEEISTLVEYLNEQLKRLETGQLDSTAITGEDGATPELASWAMTARVIMNLDETITKY